LRIRAGKWMSEFIPPATPNTHGLWYGGLVGAYFSSLTGNPNGGWRELKTVLTRHRAALLTVRN